MRSILVFFTALSLSIAPVHAQELSREEIKALVLETIRENPEIVLEALRILESRQASAQQAQIEETLRTQRDLLENDPNAPVLGNPEGDVTIVEFFDYNCPYCRRVMPEVQALLKKDPNVRLVYREWPILGEGSVFAARAALAARRQGKYDEFHWALMGMNGRAEQQSVLRIAEEIGLDIDRLRSDMKAPDIDEHIAQSMRLTQALGFSGTPSFVIGDTLIPGFVEADVLTENVAKVRAAAD
jgi:protein-disulfide isomerase